MLRVRELEAEMQKRNNVRRVIYLATALYDVALETRGRVERGRKMVLQAPWHQPFLEALESALFEAEKALQVVAHMPNLMYLAARGIFDGEDIESDPSN
jgi:hypothetical protein